MNLERLQYFVRVASTLNFTKAAEECHIAQTAMSRQIAMLEEELSIKLFDRNNRSVRLTPAGEMFYVDVCVLLAQYQKAVQRAKTVHAGAEGRLEIGIGQYERCFVSKLVQEFHSLFPAVEVQVSQYHYKELVKNLLREQVDVIFTLPTGIDCVNTKEVEVKKLFFAKTCVVVPKSHPVAQTGQATLEMLASETIITISEDEGPCALKWLQTRNELCGLRGNKVIQANSLQAAFLMVEAGMGFAYAPHFLKEELPSKLTMVPQEYYAMGGKFLAMALKSNPNPPVDLFMKLIEKSQTMKKWREQQ